MDECHRRIKELEREKRRLEHKNAYLTLQLAKAVRGLHGARGKGNPSVEKALEELREHTEKCICGNDKRPGAWICDECLKEEEATQEEGSLILELEAKDAEIGRYREVLEKIVSSESTKVIAIAKQALIDQPHYPSRRLE
jgi:hypothetical protein